MSWLSVGEYERSFFKSIACDYYKWFLQLTDSSIIDIDSFVENQCIGILEMILDSEDTPFDLTLIAVIIASFKILVEVYTDDDICTPEIVKIIDEIYDTKHIIIPKANVYTELDTIILLMVRGDIRFVF